MFGAYSCRDRAINGELGIPIATAALTCVISGAVIVDCNIWEAENNPIWCWSKTLAFTPMQHQRTDASFAMSGAGKQSTTWELRWCDPHTSNNLIIEVEKWSAKTNGLDTLVKRLNVELSIPFINNRFGTNHACAT
ncbi:TPA: hypothetical protein N0F65_004539 [Lagenidium giganteum]|uniref:Uncharacterized protein n=1 Tax=Lagenidium giganteum TaxID=4803 RepID=A0AAV2YXA2_9STRA|nr:TPA: hypothetical protein N0F65_004539 [Lagenidium giganteum]